MMRGPSIYTTIDHRPGFQQSCCLKYATMPFLKQKLYFQFFRDSYFHFLPFSLGARIYKRHRTESNRPQWLQRAYFPIISR
ncbi:hypothetical protein RUMHYD_01898 [Blautia hydrogenotrophica DSM 10507]|uniref:Uncharacterized protein n=1 Tax=Blautia hydrogenotrophica (strain DSM 10507 / JCM 14656 / S5a33) TaxID=476272 RepID=C0CM23_BLAHS|nr:hypothetical protein RUMHYD_01898 [Blautia hydrogenotrophica DSM 10507]